MARWLTTDPRPFPPSTEAVVGLPRATRISGVGLMAPVCSPWM